MTSPPYAVPTSAIIEQQRREGLRRMQQRLAAPRAVPDLPKYADLRDGGMMPRAPFEPFAIWFLLVCFVIGTAFWAFALPKIIRAFAHLIVIGASAFH